MYDVGSLHTIMAGSGKPQKVLTDLRKQIIRALHDQHSLSEIQVMFGLAHGALIAELTPLVDASLVAKRKDTYQPLFFVADADETRRVAAHATTAGEALFAQLQTDWEALSQAYQALEISRRIPFPEIAFLLVGANILDIGLLRALEQDGTLMPPSPHRPSPDAPDAHYYFWMIEGDFDALGKYGQRTAMLPYPDWTYFSFGQYRILEKANLARRSLDERVGQASEETPSPVRLAEAFRLPLFEAADVAIWRATIIEETGRLLAVYLEHESTLRDLYATLKASQTAPYGFAEFFCWYDHLAYSHTVDLLEDAGLILIPGDRFAAALWHGNASGGH